MEQEQEYLTFLIGGEEFGVDILCVQEIRVWSSVTELPNKPDYLKGVINLRGVIIPIIDLRQRFGKEPLEYDHQTVTIILSDHNETRPMVVGIVVDAVSEVYKFSQSSISNPPEFGSQIDRCFLKGLASIDDKLIILLDTQTLLDQDELYSVNDHVKAKDNSLTENVETTI
ncbi:chemotaxis protein CheW [Thalassotalea sp. G2M2-11]|uniref:chemotaxis protein CheW n=1 Tax=Thalassotalea sp. G2M2-11 TaxID=2787627 RepID=UPI0019CF9522|nr:chemotaxis protein CheW [Thalassotalea sp. G2M2-11]